MRFKHFHSLRRLLILASMLILTGCNHIVLMNPKGLIGVEQRSLIIIALLLMLIVVIPAIVMTVLFAWKYRASNIHATYTPDWADSNKIEVVVWTVPLIIILILGIITWRSAHELDPHRPLPTANHQPITIEAISLDWKWLFLYPQYGVATINQIAFPVDVPVEFKVTSYTVMNSFFIPQLGSQIYAMAGMQNRVHLVANEIGVYKGLSSNYSGHGFSGMKFTAEATTEEGFKQWLEQVKASPKTLNNMAEFEQIAKPSEHNPVEYFSAVQPELYQNILNKFAHGPSKQPHAHVKE